MGEIAKVSWAQIPREHFLTEPDFFLKDLFINWNGGAEGEGERSLI